MYYPTSVRPMSEGQCERLIKGSGVRVQRGQGETLHLTQQQIKKLLKAHEKGKAITITFDPYQAQMHAEKMGGKLKLGKAFKSVGKAIAHDTKKIAGTVADIAEDKVYKPTKKALSGKKAMDTYKKIGLHAIEQGIPIATALTSMLLGDPTGMSGAAVGNIASEYAGDAYREKVMGQGLFKRLHKMGIKGVKKPLISAAKTTAKVGSRIAGDVITHYTGSQALGDKFANMADTVAENAISGHLKRGLKEAGRMAVKDAKRFAIEAVDDYVDKNLSGNEKRLVQNAMAGKYPEASDLIYDMADMYTGTAGMTEGGALSLRKKRGRPKKYGSGVSKEAIIEMNKRGIKINGQGGKWMQLGDGSYVWWKQDNKKGGALYPSGYGGALVPA